MCNNVYMVLKAAGMTKDSEDEYRSKCGIEATMAYTNGDVVTLDRRLLSEELNLLADYLGAGYSIQSNGNNTVIKKGV